MKRMSVRVGAIVLAGLATACASGPPGPPGGEGARGPGMSGGLLQEAKIARPIALLFVGMDSNRDLVLDREELEAAIPHEFAGADTDQSGVLTGFELVDRCTRMMGDKEAQPDLRAMDTDMNYTVTLHEFTVALRHEFERMDRNQDGVLTRAEMLMDAPRQQMGGPSQGGQGAPQGQGGGRGRPPGGGGPGGGPGGGGGSPF